MHSFSNGLMIDVWQGPKYVSVQRKVLVRRCSDNAGYWNGLGNGWGTTLFQTHSPDYEINKKNIF